jgi:nitroimidazol reductase NimA-like FMN-containing flavoprotein (pyridoxamine 5'-phosphate oxidase superfamily)
MREPISVQPLTDATLVPWPEAGRGLAKADTYWVATVLPDGRPHVVPVLAVWVDGVLHFCANPESRKARNLARDPRCTVAASAAALDMVVEGEASKVSDDAMLQRVGQAYAAKYEWHVEVRGGALHGDGAPTAGPPPYAVYAVTPTTVFGFGREESIGSTRWRFS